MLHITYKAAMSEGRPVQLAEVIPTPLHSATTPLIMHVALLQCVAKPDAIVIN